MIFVFYVGISNQILALLTRLISHRITSHRQIQGFDFKRVGEALSQVLEFTQINLTEPRPSFLSPVLDRKQSAIGEKQTNIPLQGFDVGARGSSAMISSSWSLRATKPPASSTGDNENPSGVWDNRVKSSPWSQRLIFTFDWLTQKLLATSRSNDLSIRVSSWQGERARRKHTRQIKW